MQKIPSGGVLMNETSQMKMRRMFRALQRLKKNDGNPEQTRKLEWGCRYCTVDDWLSHSSRQRSKVRS